MNYLLAQVKKIRVWLVIVLLVFLLGLVGLNNIGGGFSLSGANNLLRWNFGVGQTIKNYINFFQDQTKLIEENQKLRKVFVKNLILESELNSLRIENTALRSLTELEKPEHYDLLHTEILGRDNSLGFAILILNKGQNHNVKTGNAVLSPDGILVGKIIRSEKNISFLNLINTSESAIASIIQRGDDQISGIVEGEFNLTLKMNLIPMDQDVQINDLVVTSGIEDFIPAGLPIGKIVQVSGQQDQFFQQASVESPVQFSLLKFLSILIPKSF